MICPLVIWDTLKAYLRGGIIAFSSSLKNKSRNTLLEIENEIRNLEKSHCLSKYPQLLLQIDNLKMKYNILNTKEIEMSLLKSKQRYAEHGEMIGKLLSWHIKKEAEEKTILKILKLNGNITLDPLEIK